MSCFWSRKFKHRNREIRALKEEPEEDVASHVEPLGDWKFRKDTQEITGDNISHRFYLLYATQSPASNLCLVGSSSASATPITDTCKYETEQKSLPLPWGISSQTASFWVRGIGPGFRTASGDSAASDCARQVSVLGNSNALAGRGGLSAIPGESVRPERLWSVPQAIHR